MSENAFHADRLRIRRSHRALREVACALLTVGFLCHAGAAPVLTSVDHDCPPVGETMTFQGTALADTTAVSLFWTRFESPAVFTAVSDMTLGVVFPEPRQPNRNHHILVQTTTGSTVTLPFGQIQYVTGTGSAGQVGRTGIVVRPGAVATSVAAQYATFLYVEAGGVVQGIANDFQGFIFAEDGATVDFRGSTFAGGSSPPTFYHSPQTTILGTVPQNVVVREITPLALNTTLGPFTNGLRMNVTIVGDGSVDIAPFRFVRPNTLCTLTATPGPGSVFNAWTGAVTSQAPVIEKRISNSDLSFTATFSTGYRLEMYPGTGGTVTRAPEGDAFAPGQPVTLTATSLPGHAFVGWGGHLSGITENPTTLVMDDNKVLTAIFRRDDFAELPRLTSVDYHAVPVGETMTFQGTGLADTTAVSFLWASLAIPSTFNAVSDGTLEVAFPAPFQSARSHFLLVETATGSTLTLPSSAPAEFTGVGPMTLPGFSILLRAGAVANSIPKGPPTFVYVEAGAVLRGIPKDSMAFIFAEDGAALDFRGTDFAASTFTRPNIYHGPGTVLLGTPPTPSSNGGNVRQITSPVYSPGFGTFSDAARVTVTVEGNGTVLMEPDSPYMRVNAEFTLTAVPGEGAAFSHWSGKSTALEPIITLRAGSSDILVTAHFAEGFTLETFDGGGGSITVDPARDAYPSGESVALTASAAPGFEFLGWGGDLLAVAAATTDLAMDANKRVTAIFRRTDHASLPLLSAVDHTAVPVGTTMNFQGTGLADATAATFLWAHLSTGAAVNALSDTALEVPFPAPFQSGREHFLLVETATGSAVTLPDETPSEFTGVGILTNAQPSIVVKAGAVATAISQTFLPFVYVEAGAVLGGIPASLPGFIFAEDGATLDFRNSNFAANSMRRPNIYHGAGTVILGTPPTPDGEGGGIVRQVASLRLSPGLGTFSDACALVPLIEGPGTVTLEPAQVYYRRNATVQVTAVPAPGAFFVRWVGALTTTNASESFHIGADCALTARFSENPDFFSQWRTRYFTAAQLADPTVSGLESDPDRDSFTNVAEYAFATDPTVPNRTGGIRITGTETSPGGESVILLEYFRPENAADIQYAVLVSTTLASGGDVGGFSVIERSATRFKATTEKVVLAVTFAASPPPTLFFRLSANIEDLPP